MQRFKDVDFEAFGEYTLQVGDVYITRHSSLASVQVLSYCQLIMNRRARSLLLLV